VPVSTYRRRETAAWLTGSRQGPQAERRRPAVRGFGRLPAGPHAAGFERWWLTGEAPVRLAPGRRDGVRLRHLQTGTHTEQPASSTTAGSTCRHRAVVRCERPRRFAECPARGVPPGQHRTACAPIVRAARTPAGAASTTTCPLRPPVRPGTAQPRVAALRPHARAAQSSSIGAATHPLRRSRMHPRVAHGRAAHRLRGRRAGARRERRPPRLPAAVSGGSHRAPARVCRWGPDGGATPVVVTERSVRASTPPPSWPRRHRLRLHARCIARRSPTRVRHELPAAVRMAAPGRARSCSCPERRWPTRALARAPHPRGAGRCGGRLPELSARRRWTRASAGASAALDDLLAFVREVAAPRVYLSAATTGRWRSAGAARGRRGALSRVGRCAAVTQAPVVAGTAHAESAGRAPPTTGGV